MNFKLSAPFAIAAALATLGPGLSAATPSGDALYQQRCASCHDSGKSTIPSKDALKKLAVARIRTSMDFGTMGGVATTMRRDERDAWPLTWASRAAMRLLPPRHSAPTAT